MWMRAMAVVGMLAVATDTWAGVPQHTLWGADGAEGQASDLLILNQGSGAVVATVGPIGFAVTGLAVDPTNGTLYGATGSQAEANRRSLITIDRATGAGTLVAPFSPSLRINDITIDSAGQMFGFAHSDEAGDGVHRLVRIDKATGAVTPFGDPVGEGPGAGLAFCGPFLYLASSGSSGDLRLADPVTGDTTLVGTIPDAPLPNRAIGAMACRADGALFAANVSNDPDVTHLIRLDRFDGDVADDVGPSIIRLDAIAFDGVWEFGARAIPSAATVGQTVTFTGVRANAPFTVGWDFDDGATADGATVTHTFTAAGTYDVTFTAESSGPTKVSGTLQVTVVAPAPAGRRQILWGVDGSGGDCGNNGGWGCGAEAWLYRIDTANGAATPVGSIGHAIPAIAVDPTNGTLYGITGYQSPNSATPLLVRIDKATGVATEIAPINPAGPEGVFSALPDIAFDASGQLFAWNEDTDDLYRLDKATGALTLVGVSGESTSGSGITFNLMGTLFGMFDGPGPTDPLATVNVLNGAYTAGPTIMGLPADFDEVPALSTNTAGMIYGVTSDQPDPGVRPTVLFTIDPVTGNASQIGRTISFCDAIEFEPIEPLDVEGPPTIAPQPAIAGDTVTFTANATGFGGLPVGAAWDFGDGMTGSGSPATHIYTAPGTYNGTVTLDDGQSTPVEQDFTVTIAPDLGLARALIRLNFAKANKDRIRLQGKLPVADGFDPANATAAIHVGGVETDVPLNAKGRGTGVSVKTNGKFKVALAKGAFADDLADEGLIDEAVKDKPVTVRMTLQVGPNPFGTYRALAYSAKAGKSGRAK